MDSKLLSIHQQLTAALDVFVTGDAGPYKDLWAHRTDVSLMGAFGGRNVGWTQINPRLDLAANQYKSSDAHWSDRRSLLRRFGARRACSPPLRATTTSQSGLHARTPRCQHHLWQSLPSRMSSSAAAHAPAPHRPTAPAFSSVTPRSQMTSRPHARRTLQPDSDLADHAHRLNASAFRNRRVLEPRSGCGS